MALTLYETVNPVLPEFGLQRREVCVESPKSNLTFSVRQNWNAHGVAGVVWESALVLATFLWNDQDRWVVDKNVVELGAGTGIPSMTAALAGARSVTATDLSSVIPILTDNINQNMINSSTQRSRIKIKALDWKEFAKCKNEYDTKSKIDLIIGADLIYDAQLFNPLFDVLLDFVKINQKSEFLIAAKIRYPKDSAFIDKLRQTFDVNLVHNESNINVQIHHLVIKKPYLADEL